VITRLTWWEWEELADAIEARGDLWLKAEHPRPTYYRTLDGEPVYVLQASPTAPSAKPSDFRFVQLELKPITWTEDEVQVHFDYIRNGFTSYAFRQSVQQFLQNELKLEEQKAFAASVVIARMEQGPLSEPAQTQDVREPLSHSFGKWILTQKDGNARGHVRFSEQSGMMRVDIEISRGSMLRGYSIVKMLGHVRLQCSNMENTIAILQGLPFKWELETEDPKAGQLDFAAQEDGV